MMLRNVGGVIAGIIVAILGMALISWLGGFFVPAPPVDYSSTEAIQATYSALGMDSQLLLLLSWFFGVLAGAAVAKRIVGRPWAAWTIAILLECYLLLSVLILPMPGWMQILALLLPLAAGFIANRLIPTRLEVVDDGPDVAADVEA